MFKSAGVKTLFMTPFCLWAGIFIFVPLLCMIWYGLTNDDEIFTPANLTLAFEPPYFKALLLSIGLALVSTIICLLLAYPLCLILTDKARDLSTAVSLLFILPLWMNSLLLTMAWQTILEKNGIINQVLRYFNLPDVALINTPTAIIIGMVYNFLPYMVLPLYVSLSKIDKRIIEAARDLGASYMQTFWKVILPLSLPGAAGGMTMVFIPALTTFVISALLGGGKLLLIGNVIEQEFIAGYNWHWGAGLSMVLMIFILINMAVTIFFDNSHEEVEEK